MARLILLIILAGCLFAILLLIASALRETRPVSRGALPMSRNTGIQKVAYGVFIAFLFAMGSGALGGL